MAMRFCADSRILLMTRFSRMFSYGAVAVVLYLFLLHEFPSEKVGLLLMLIMLGDFFMSMIISSRADRHWSRKAALRIGTLFKCIAGVGFALFSSNFAVLAFCGTIGVITPTGGEIGPFLSVETAALAELGDGDINALSYVMAWYQVIGGIAAAAGAAAAGVLVTWSQSFLHQRPDVVATLVEWDALLTFAAAQPQQQPSSMGPAVGLQPHHNGSSSVAVVSQAHADGLLSATIVSFSYRSVFLLYTLCATFMLCLYSRLTSKVESVAFDVNLEAVERVSSGRNDEVDGGEGGAAAEDTRVSSPQQLSCSSWVLSKLCGVKDTSSHNVVLKLSALFALDAFAGALVLQSYLALWLHDVWGVAEDELGGVLMVVNTIGGLSGFVSSWLVRRIGAIATMVFTHLPSNILLLLVPLMPSEVTAVGMLFARCCISQMDVPARQTYVATVVPSAERSAVNGVTNSARTIGVSLAPPLLPLFLSSTKTMMDVPFFLAAVLKILYDITLYYQFTHHETAGPLSAEKQRERESTSNASNSPSETTRLSAVTNHSHSHPSYGSVR